MDKMLLMGLLLVAITPFAFLGVYAFYTIGRKVVHEYRKRYMEALLVQESEWFDERNPEEIPSQVNSELKDLECGSGTAFGFAILSNGMVLFGLLCTFYIGALYGCCLLIIFPAAIAVGGLYAGIMVSDAEATESKYVK